MEVSPSVAGVSTKSFDVDGMLHLPFTRISSWWCYLVYTD